MRWYHLPQLERVLSRFKHSQMELVFFFHVFLWFHDVPLIFGFLCIVNFVTVLRGVRKAYGSGGTIDLHICTTTPKS